MYTYTRGRNVNQRIVAKMAGVSSATVSRVVNNDSGGSPETAQKVKEIISKCGYVQNAVARNLKMAKTKIIGYLVPDIRNPFFPLVLAGIEQVCWERGYDIILENTDEDIVKEKRAINALLRSRVDGLIADFVDPDSEDVRMIEKMGIPLVLIDRKPANGKEADYVVIDNIGGISKLMEYLLGLGHRKIAMIHGPLTNTPGAERLKSYYAELRRAGIEINGDYVQNGMFYEEEGYACASRLIRMKEPPTAIITANMTMTMGAFKALLDNSVQIPKDISLAGFDDFTLAAYLTPPLTVVDRPTGEMGKIAAELLLERIENKDAGPKREIVLPTSLLVRKSCSYHGGSGL
jgi:LacI family transcriptional regulator